MIEFKPPSLTAFQRRKVFHMCHREQAENIEMWLNRIKKSIANCSYGVFRNFMLMDKFMSELNDEEFQHFSKKSSWSEERLKLLTGDKWPSYDPSRDTETNHKDGLKLLHMPMKDEIEVFPSDNFSSGDDDESEKNEFLKHYTIKDADNDSNTCQQGIIIQPVSSDLKTKSKSHIAADEIIKQKYPKNYERSYVCELCEKDCICRSRLKTHMRKHLHMGKTFSCHLCGMFYQRLLGLKIHFNRMHVGTRKQKLFCIECDKTFLDRVALERHIRIHKGLAQLHKCPKCSKEFELRCRMMAHLARHSSVIEERLICEICGQIYRSRKLLNMHRETHSEVRYKCQVCDLLLKNSNTYRIHQRQHTGERPHRCSLCPKTFVTAPSYKKHLMVHNKIKPHACRVCTGRFATSYHLKIHMNRHTGDKPYQCTKCDTRFSQPQSLNTHRKRFHIQNDTSQ